MTDSQFVNSLYESFLGRPDSPPDFWTNALAQGDSRADVVVGIANSAEAKGHLASTTAQVFVPNASGALTNELYETGLARQVDLPALANAETALASITPADLANGIAASPEFQALHGGQSNAAYVNSLYEAGLGRAADASGSQFWTNLLDTGGASRANVLLGIATSPEGVAHLTHSL
jgi:Domain of unknown function (DUF4214)